MLIGRIRIEPDEGGRNPRKDADYGSTLYAVHRRYDFSDKQAPKLDRGGFSNWDDVKQALIRTEDAVVILPVYMYDHSGLSVQTHPFGCRWDSGQLGFIYVPRRNLRDYYGVQRLTAKSTQRIEASLRQDIEVLNTYLTEGCYALIIEARDGSDWEQVDSCGGFIGSDVKTNGMMDYLKPWIAKGYEIVE